MFPAAMYLLYFKVVDLMRNIKLESETIKLLLVSSWQKKAHIFYFFAIFLHRARMSPIKLMRDVKYRIGNDEISISHFFSWENRESTRWAYFICI